MIISIISKISQETFCFFDWKLLSRLSKLHSKRPEEGLSFLSVFFKRYSQIWIHCRGTSDEKTFGTFVKMVFWVFRLFFFRTTSFFWEENVLVCLIPKTEQELFWFLAKKFFVRFAKGQNCIACNHRKFLVENFLFLLKVYDFFNIWQLFTERFVFWLQLSIRFTKVPSTGKKIFGVFWNVFRWLFLAFDHNILRLVIKVFYLAGQYCTLLVLFGGTFSESTLFLAKKLILYSISKTVPVNFANLPKKTSPDSKSGINSTPGGDFWIFWMNIFQFFDYYFQIKRKTLRIILKKFSVQLLNMHSTWWPGEHLEETEFFGKKFVLKNNLEF